MSDIKVGATHRFIVDAEGAGERLDKFLAAQPLLQEQTISRTRLKALIEDGRVQIGDVFAREAGTKLGIGDVVVIDLPPPVEAVPRAEDIPLAVVFEDEQLIVIDKPAGLVVHPAAGHETGTLVNALLAHCGQSLSGIGGVRRPGIVHRLEKDTSGLMVVAKTDAAHQALAKLFADHGRTMDFTRGYRAFVWGAPARKTGTVDAPVGRHAQHREKMAIVPLAAGRYAVTHWSLRESFRDGIVSEIDCRLETGRTHQIRIHMAHLGHPVLGDRTYGSGFRTKERLLDDVSRAALNDFGRQALHAATLGFPHPVTRTPLMFESGLPPDLARLRAALAAG